MCRECGTSGPTSSIITVLMMYRSMACEFYGQYCWQRVIQKHGMRLLWAVLLAEGIACAGPAVIEPGSPPATAVQTGCRHLDSLCDAVVVVQLLEERRRHADFIERLRLAEAQAERAQRDLGMTSVACQQMQRELEEANRERWVGPALPESASQAVPQSHFQLERAYDRPFML